MPNVYLTDEISTLTSSHKRAMEEMQRAAQTQGDAGLRAIQLWQQLVALLTEEEALAAGAIVQTRATAMWAESKTNEAKGLDSLALALGTTRAALLAELAEVPATY